MSIAVAIAVILSFCCYLYIYFRYKVPKLAVSSNIEHYDVYSHNTISNKGKLSGTIVPSGRSNLRGFPQSGFYDENPIGVK